MLLFLLISVVLSNAAPREDPVSFEETYGPAMRLTWGESNDEDGDVALADDGTNFFLWMSDRAGNKNIDIWEIELLKNCNNFFSF